MSFLKKKMSQNDWSTILPFGPVTLFFYWPKKIISGQPKASPYLRHCSRLRGIQASTCKDFWLISITFLTVAAGTNLINC